MIGDLSDRAEEEEEEPISNPKPKFQRLQTTVAAAEPQRGMLSIPRLKDTNAQFLIEVSQARKKFDL